MRIPRYERTLRTSPILKKGQELIKNDSAFLQRKEEYRIRWGGLSFQREEPKNEIMEFVWRLDVWKVRNDQDYFGVLHLPLNPVILKKGRSKIIGFLMHNFKEEDRCKYAMLYWHNNSERMYLDCGRSESAARRSVVFGTEEGGVDKKYLYPEVLFFDIFSLVMQESGYGVYKRGKQVGIVEIQDYYFGMFYWKAYPSCSQRLDLSWLIGAVRMDKYTTPKTPEENIWAAAAQLPSLDIIDGGKK